MRHGPSRYTTLTFFSKENENKPLELSPASSQSRIRSSNRRSFVCNQRGSTPKLTSPSDLKENRAPNLSETHRDLHLPFGIEPNCFYDGLDFASEEECLRLQIERRKQRRESRRYAEYITSEVEEVSQDATFNLSKALNEVKEESYYLEYDNETPNKVRASKTPSLPDRVPSRPSFAHNTGRKRSQLASSTHVNENLSYNLTETLIDKKTSQAPVTKPVSGLQSRKNESDISQSVSLSALSLARE